MRCGVGKSEGRDGKSGKARAKKWFVRCYGCGGDHRWMACHAVGPISQKERCTRCGKKGHIAKVFTEAAAAKAAFVRNYGKPWEFEQNLRTAMTGSETEIPALRDGGRKTATATATATATDNTEDAARRRHTPKGRDPGAAHAMGAETGVETGAATRAETGAGTQGGTAARNAAAAAKGVETRGGPGAATKGAAEAGAAAETAGLRQVTVTRGERTSPRGCPPHMPCSGKGFRRRPRCSSG